MVKIRSKFLIGFGYDCHKIVKNRLLFLGGVQIEENFGLLGHSDADVVLHSVCDAILSALGVADIGELFPNSVDKYKNIPSRLIVDKTFEFLKIKKFNISNIDITLVCDKPQISQYKKQILNSLKNLFKIESINIKGKTTEGIKSFKDYIQCYSVVLLYRK